MSKLRIGTNFTMVVCSIGFLVASGIYWYTSGRQDENDWWYNELSKESKDDSSKE